MEDITLEAMKLELALLDEDINNCSDSKFAIEVLIPRYRKLEKQIKEYGRKDLGPKNIYDSRW
jgi:hypothetical protein